MSAISFYETTNRSSITQSAINSVKRAYTYNYLSLLPDKKDARVVDIGCSEGIALGWLATNGYHNIVGVDADEGAIEIAKKNCSPILKQHNFICMEGLEYLLQCEDSSVDMVIMFNVIEHIPKDAIVDFMKQIRRVLKDGGSFLAQTGNWENPFNIGLFARDFTHQVMYTKSSLKQLMLLSGFRATNILLAPVKYKTTLRNFSFNLLAGIFGWMIRRFAAGMRIRIHETSPLIYCYTKL